MPADPAPLAYASRESIAAAPQRRLSLFDAVCIIVGVIIGAGIFETAGTVAQAAGGPVRTLLFWLAGGAMSLVGALCYAELATAYPKEGGEYVFLSRAYGSRVGFLFAWVGFWIVRPGSIGAMAYVFGHYLSAMTLYQEPGALFTPGKWVPRIGEMPAAALLVIILTFINLLGVRVGKRMQNALTTVKLLGIALVIVAGMWTVGAKSLHASGFFSGGGHDYRLALIFVLFTYGGWNEIAYVAAEVREPERNISRALVLGTSLVTVVYLFFTAAILPGLYFAHGVDDRYIWAVSFDWAMGGYSRWLGWLTYILVAVSVVGAVQGMIFSGSRIYYAVGADHATYRWLGRWDPRGGGVPVRSLIAQGAVTLFLVVLFGLESGGFGRMVIFTTPVFNVFFLLAAISVFVLRRRDPSTPRPYRVPLYPITPTLFAASCVFMLWSSLTYAYENRRLEALWSIGLLMAGVVACFLTVKRSESAKAGAFAVEK